MIVLWPSNTKAIIEEIIGQIGRPVDFMQVTYSACPVCDLEPVTNVSTDSFCPTCSGLYWIPIFSGITVSAHVTWKPSDVLEWETGGQIFTGDCLVKIMFTDANHEMVKNNKFIVVDGKEVKIKKTYLRGVQQINRILLETEEKEQEHE